MMWCFRIVKSTRHYIQLFVRHQREPITNAQSPIIDSCQLLLQKVTSSCIICCGPKRSWLLVICSWNIKFNIIKNEQTALCIIAWYIVNDELIYSNRVLFKLYVLCILYTIRFYFSKGVRLILITYFSKGFKNTLLHILTIFTWRSIITIRNYNTDEFKFICKWKKSYLNMEQWI